MSSLILSLIRRFLLSFFPSLLLLISSVVEEGQREIEAPEIDEEVYKLGNVEVAAHIEFELEFEGRVEVGRGVDKSEVD